MIRLTKERVSDVLAYMEDDLPNCLYLYGDIVRYGVDDPNMTVWYSEKDGKFTAVVMKYFSGSQVYSKDLDYDLDELVEQLQSFSPDRISARREIAENLYQAMQDKYKVEYGLIVQTKNYRKILPKVKVERAKPEDAEEIAELIMSDTVFSSTYNVKLLAEELENRLRTGIGRGYIIRDGGRIVAHDGASLEMDQYVILSLSIVHKDFRDKFYGAIIESYAVSEIQSEGKRIYSFLEEGARANNFIRAGNELKAQYGKLFKSELGEK